MLFNSYVFLFAFLPVVFGGFFFLGNVNRRAAATFLVFASLCFYGWLDARFVALLLLSIAFNFTLGRLIAARPIAANSLLVFAVTGNLVVLGVFKYADFFIDVANRSGASLPLLHIVLPLGISFFTFTQIAFLVDVKRGLAREFDLVHYALFVTWFPHLVAGPILHHSQMMSQFGQAKNYRIRYDDIATGFTQFVMGLAKKVLLADTFAGFASPIFDRASRCDIPMFFDAWVGALAYAFQLYFDFSGYSDMALGLSLFFGIRLPLNFNSPYKARSIIDFWRRWHITLSTFLRDYLYLPLGGNRKGESRRFINLIVTMILGGLWHGAGWTFVVWGFLHAAYLCANHGWRHLTRRSELEPVSRLKDGVSLIVTFVAVVVAWVPFRAADMHSAVVVWKGLAGANGFSVPVRLQERLPSSVGALVEGRGFTPLMDAAPATTLLLILVGLIAVWALPNTQEILRSRSPAYDVRALHRTRLAWQPRPAVAALAGATLGICILFFRRNSPFLYFQF